MMNNAMKMTNEEFFKTAVIMRGRVFHPIDGRVEHGCNDDFFRVEFTLDPMSSEKFKINKTYDLKDVIFNPPATIVLWGDGTKTVVKAQNGEPFDPEKGLAMAIVKKTYDNTGRYYDVIEKFTRPYYFKNKYPNAVKYFKEIDFDKKTIVLPGDPDIEVKCKTDEYFEEMFRLYEGTPGMKSRKEAEASNPRPEKPWKIWVKERDAYGNVTSISHTSFNYSSRASALRRARKLYGELEGHIYHLDSLIDSSVEWRVAQENPFTIESDI